MLAFILLLFSYLIGSISFSIILGKLIRKVDIRHYGSGNAGATNTLRVLGKGPAAAVFLLDIGKAVLAVVLTERLVPEPGWIPVLSGILVVIGHNWPIFFRFRGGKGIASTIGMVLALAPLAGIAAGAAAILSIVATRYVSLGSLLFTGLLPIFLLVFRYPGELVWGCLAIAVLAWFRHRANIVRLLNGTENKLGAKGKS